MKQLTDQDIENMLSDRAAFDTPRIGKIKRPEHPLPAPRRIDCHGKTEEQVWQSILHILHDFQIGGEKAILINIISGRSGIMKEKICDWITRGVLSKFVADWRLDNPGSYVIRFKFRPGAEIILQNDGLYKIIA